MSDLFKGSKSKYYHMISTLEQERDAMKSMHTFFAEKTAINNREYFASRAKVTSSLRRQSPSIVKPASPSRLHKSTEIRRPVCRAAPAPQARLESPFHSCRARTENRSWPLRKSGAPRVFSPEKLNDLRESEDALRHHDEPVIHDTGIRGLSHNPAWSDIATDFSMPKPYGDIFDL